MAQVVGFVAESSARHIQDRMGPCLRVRRSRNQDPYNRATSWQAHLALRSVSIHAAYAPLGYGASRTHEPESVRCVMVKGVISVPRLPAVGLPSTGCVSTARQCRSRSIIGTAHERFGMRDLPTLWCPSADTRVPIHGPVSCAATPRGPDDRCTRPCPPGGQGATPGHPPQAQAGLPAWAGDGEQLLATRT